MQYMRRILLKTRFFTAISGLILSVPVFAQTSVILPVPFVSQAPMGVWSYPWQDFCEEASVVMAAHFLWKLPLPTEFAADEMLLIKKYEETAFGKYKDTDTEETARILRELYGFAGTKVVYNPTLDDIKKLLSSGQVLIAPAAGRLLGNPYFRFPGPLYHMFVIKGFDDSRGVFITNEPGTRHGENFLYPQKVLYDAIRDLNGGDVLRGKKAVIAVSY